MYWWKDFERDEVAEEFDVIAGLGMRLVRIFLLWEDFQPTPTGGLERGARPTSRSSATWPPSAAWAWT